MSWACTGKRGGLQKGNRGEKPGRYEGKRPLQDVGSKQFGSGAPSTAIRQITPTKLTKGNRERGGLFWGAEGEEGAWLERADEAERRLQA